ncbi:MAG TPA: 4,5-DOPA dioxygenase extradiol [Thermoanaerobaculia bacterium]|jgi:4,5-DOPA dioxygenase extradiol|nr:4,5-DOPA dioxygenase extradiol [Thermoanaerobaculia bacterium]
MNARLPVIFFGHGNPMNAIEENAYTKAWSQIGKTIPRPKAIVAVSAHWYLPATMVTAVEHPRTIHDFGGFPRPLYEVRYNAPGDPALARRLHEMLNADLDDRWGFDHGTWSVLCHVYPNADVPVVQLSIDETQPASFHFDLGKRLATLRDEGILIIGSGNLVHNLHAYAWGRHPVEPFDWALRFEAQARALIESGDYAPLVDYESMGRDAMLSAPTPDHYLPLMYVLGAAHPGERVSFPVEGIDGGSVSMLTVQIG